MGQPRYHAFRKQGLGAYHLGDALLEGTLGVEDGRGHDAHDVEAEVVVLVRVEHVAVHGPRRQLRDLLLQLLQPRLLRRRQVLLVLGLYSACACAVCACRVVLLAVLIITDCKRE